MLVYNKTERRLRFMVGMRNEEPTVFCNLDSGEEYIFPDEDVMVVEDVKED